MPWYKSGTVKTTNNSNAIIGTGTAFIANSRVGDAFRGPDGAWYEVTNIASDTAMSIAPNYQGPTVAAGSYALAPMQGYVKDLADQARAIIQQWGNALANLGTVSTENVVPLSKGGTGGTTQAAARAGLGLGSAATATIGTAAGNLIAVGTSGISSNTPPFASGYDGPGSLQGGGFYQVGAGPSSSGVTYAAMIRVPYGDKYEAQIFFPMGASTSKILFRCAQGASGGSFGLAQEIYHTGNTTRAADGTLKAI